MDPDGLLVQEYTRMSLVYEERVVPRFVPIATRTVADAALRPGDRVLDVGCGTGLATLLAAEQVGPQGEVVGVDASEGQLGIALGKARLRGLGHVRFVRADAQRLDLDLDGTFDAVVCNLGLPDDTQGAFAAMLRALRPGGRLALAAWDLGESPALDAFREVVQRHRVEQPDPALAALRAAGQVHRGAMERVGSPARLSAELTRAGFDEVQVREVRDEVRFQDPRALLDFMASWGATDAELRAMPATRRETVLQDLRERLGPGPIASSWGLLHARAERPRGFGEGRSGRVEAD